ncbi:concanavalin A-like lectin/glucanase domain-containing protein [Cyathus striatus]|nr:concanavalin A-like lectin/glucanase domain-containing protein [Cyathus striatus]
MFFAFRAKISLAASYGLVKDYSGDSFFQDWDFFDGYDSSTSGDEMYLNAQAAAAANLAYVDPYSKHAFLKVDSTTTVLDQQKRNSVKITTKASYNLGSIWVADIFHAPYGCGLWPAIWSWAPHASGSWPAGGEIDTFEAVNQARFNQMGLHTKAGCVGPNPNTNQNSLSIVNTTDCKGDHGQGCIVTDAGHPSYGPDFNNNGGGVFITEFAHSGISIWFFPRPNVPHSILSGSNTIDTSTLGIPAGNWPASSCGRNGFAGFFEPQSIVFHIVLCGSFGRWAYNKTCAPGDCYRNTVLGDGSNFANAYFEIGSVRVFSSKSTGGTSSSGGHAASQGNSSRDAWSKPGVSL